MMLKPDGFTRMCSADEVAALQGVWADLLTWLRGADPDALPHADIIGDIARKAALRMVRYPEYDINTWVVQAGDAIPRARLNLAGTEPRSLLAVATELLLALGFTAGTSYSGWLNRVTIELLYGDAPMFHANCERLVPLLLKGPVLIQSWQGPRRELAHALKFLLRLTLSASGLTNLIHIESVTEVELDHVERSLLTEAG